MKKLKVVLLIAIMVVSVCFVTGCGKDEGPGKEKKTETKEDVNFDEEVEKYLKMTPEELQKKYIADESGKATEEEFLELIKTSKYFKNLEAEDENSYKEPQNFNQVLKNIESAGGYCNLVIAVNKKLYNSKDLYTKCFAINCIRRVDIDQKEKMKLFKELMKKEKDPVVKIQLLYNLNIYTSNSDVMDYYLKCAKDSNASVRKASAMGISFNSGEDDHVKLAKILLADKDSEVVRKAAENSKLLNSESVVDPLTKILNNDEMSEEAKASAGMALASFWRGAPSFNVKSKKAYDAYTKYLQECIDNNNEPDNFVLFGATFPSVDRNEWQTWLKETGYYDGEKFIGIMRDILKMKDGSFIVKSSALRVIYTYGSLQQLKDTKSIIDGYDDVLKKQLTTTYDDLVSKYGSET